MKRYALFILLLVLCLLAIPFAVAAQVHGTRKGILR